MMRTHTCGELRPAHIGQTVTLTGWCHRSRDHGGLIFLDLRDRSGLVQLVFNPEEEAEAHAVAARVRSEWVVKATGVVRQRPPGTENPNLDTGQVEVAVSQVEVLNEAKTPPFSLTETQDVKEEVRLQYRYLDLRRRRMRDVLEFRHRVVKTVRDYFDGVGFWEVETPMLWKSTPEGAREFVVPSRLYPGKGFVLPQSPQLCKQLLMVAGVEKYFQIARCFRDEDQRADRQPEFTQIDVEMSFIDQEDILAVIEGMFQAVMKECLGVDIATPFPRIGYTEAMARFGSDKPDMRFGMELVDISDIVRDCNFRVFTDTIAKGGQVKAINAKGCAHYTRKQVENLADLAKSFGARGLATWALGESDIRSQVAKFLTQEQMEEIFRRTDAGPGDLVLACADKPDIVADALGRLRLELGNRLGLIPADEWDFHWVVDFPLFGWNETEQRYDPMHHPFCMPQPDDLPLLEEGYHTEAAPGSPEHPWSRVRASLYDLVLRGYEIAGGSIRTHRRDIQQQVFGAIGLDMEDARRRFGFLLEAFEYGAPPHGGIAVGLDRVIAILAGCENIREVIAFPKTASVTCPLTGAPTPMDEATLRELHLLSIAPEEDEEEDEPEPSPE